MENQVILSLARWPKQPVSRHIKLSPTTLRVIKNVKLQVHSLLPISFSQYVLQNNLTNTKKSEANESYNRQIQRRLKKIQILREIWIKVKQKRSKSSKQYSTLKYSYVFRNQKLTNQRNSSRSLQGQIFTKKQSKLPLIFQTNSPRHGPTYFDYYNTNQKKKNKYKNCEQQQSTQSRKQKTNSSKNNQQCLNNHRCKTSLQNRKQKNKQYLLNQMSQVLKQWSQLDNKHMYQLQYVSDVTDYQRKRLIKIHQIQKQKLRKKIQNLQTKISSFKKLKNFT